MTSIVRVVDHTQHQHPTPYLVHPNTASQRGVLYPRELGLYGHGVAAGSLGESLEHLDGRHHHRFMFEQKKSEMNAVEHNTTVVSRAALLITPAVDRTVQMRDGERHAAPCSTYVGFTPKLNATALVVAQPI